MGKRRKWFDGVLICFVGVVVLATAFYAFMMDACMRRNQMEIGKLRARGEPVTIEDIIPKPVPTKLNAAVVYNRAFTILKSSSYKNNDQDAISNILDEKKRNADPKTWQDARTALNRNRALLLLVDEALRKPECQFDVKWKDGLGALFNHVGRMRELGRVEAADALINAHNGKMDAALKSIITEIRLSESTGQEPVAISQMVRWETLRSACDMIRVSSEINGITQAQARELDAVLARIDLHFGFINALRTDRVLGLATYDEIKQNGLKQCSSYLASAPSDAVALNVAASNIGRPMLYADRLIYLRSMNKVIALSNKPYYKVAPATYTMNPINSAPSYAPVSRALFWCYERNRISYETERAHLAATRTALGILAYKDCYGVYPKSLTELRSKLAWDTHKDPFSGKDLLYKKTAKGFIVYSVGANMTDEGGKAPPADGSDPYSADVVWEYQGR